MRVVTESSGKLIVTSTSQFFDWLLLGAALLCTVPTLRGALHGSFDLNESTPLIGSAFFLFGFLFCFERSRFAFDPALGCIRWSRRGIASTQGGMPAFSQVKSVVLQTFVRQYRNGAQLSARADYRQWGSAALQSLCERSSGGI
ncbi:MAG: hypothetical protein ACREJU_20975 [Nitrospiraceae bacterium]